jgi:hypothetical protein
MAYRIQELQEEGYPPPPKRRRFSEIRIQTGMYVMNGVYARPVTPLVVGKIEKDLLGIQGGCSVDGSAHA